MTSKKKTVRKKTVKTKLPIYKKWSTYLYTIGGLITFFLIYIFYRISLTDRKLLTLSFIPLFLGILYENKRLTTDWKIVLLKALCSLILSFLAFLPGKRENNYDFEKHIEVWPFWFLFLFILISVIIHDKKVIPKLTEGITLIQSISILYWIIDINFFENLNIFSFLLILISFLISLYSIIHAFTYIPLSKNTRLFLSIWSSIVMIVFAIEHIFRVFNSPNIEDSNLLSGLLITIQYFILGISSMYILQNFFMIVEYLPSKHRFYDKTHMKDIRIMNKTHVERYSDKQVKIIDSFYCLVYCLSFYFLNYKHNFVPRHTVIWIVFLTFPIILNIKDRILNSENVYKSSANSS